MRNNQKREYHRRNGVSIPKGAIMSTYILGCFNADFLEFQFQKVRL